MCEMRTKYERNAVKIEQRARNSSKMSPKWAKNRKMADSYRFCTNFARKMAENSLFSAKKKGGGEQFKTKCPLRPTSDLPSATVSLLSSNKRDKHCCDSRLAANTPTLRCQQLSMAVLRPETGRLPQNRERWAETTVT